MKKTGDQSWPNTSGNLDKGRRLHPQSIDRATQAERGSPRYIQYEHFQGKHETHKATLNRCRYRVDRLLDTGSTTQRYVAEETSLEQRKSNVPRIS